MHSYQQPEAPVRQWIENNPEYIPYYQDLPQDIQVFTGAVATMIANTLVHNAGQNAARMFTFNQMAANGWANPDFVQIVRLALTGIVFYVNRGIARTPQEAMMTLIPQLVGWVVASNALQYLVQTGAIDANGIQIAQNNAATFQQFMQQINAPVNNFQQPMQQGNFQPQFQQAMPQGNFTGGFVQPQKPWGQPGPATPEGRWANKPTQQRTYTDQGVSNTQTTFQEAPAGERQYRPRSVPEPVVEQPRQNPQPMKENPSMNDTKPLEWERSKYQPYAIYVDDHFFIRNLEEVRNTTGESFRENTHNQQIILEKYTPKTSEMMYMERDKHQTLYFDGNYKRNPVEQKTAIKEEISTLLKLRDETQPLSAITRQIKEELQYATYLAKERIIAFDKYRMITNGLMNLLESSAKRPYVYLVKATLIYTFVVGKTFEPNWGNANIYSVDNALIQYAHLCRAAMKRYTSDEAAETFMMLLDAKITKDINDYFKHVLYLKLFSIDSYLDDIDQIAPALLKMYGQTYVDAFTKFGQLYMKALNVSREDVRTTEEEYSNYENASLVTFLPEDYTIIYIDLLSKEINVTSEPKYIKQQGMWLDMLVQAYYKEIKDRCHVLLVTRDQQVFRINQAPLMSSTDFVISKY
jgi:hypothetical protein